jgi:protein-tyrosine phosphatase
VIDLHTHILPGIDDGARSLQESLELGRSAAIEGVTTVAATPHVRADYPTTAEQMEEGVATLRTEFRAAGVPVEVIHGGEMEIDTVVNLDPNDVNRFTLGQTGRYLLVEFPYSGWPFALEGLLHSLRARGITPIIAHPERNPEIQGRPSMIGAAVELGALVQVTAGSISGLFGRGARRAVKRLLELGLVHVLASDVHRPGFRDGELAAAADLVGGGALGRYLTEDTPASIALGLPVSQPPRTRRVRFLSLSKEPRRFVRLQRFRDAHFEEIMTMETSGPFRTA